MNKMRLLSVLLGLFALVQGANAMEGKSNFEKELDTEFFGFKKLDASILEQMISAVPQQSELWSCGKHQCGHALTCARGDKPDLNYNEPDSYPLAINANIKRTNLAQILQMPVVNIFAAQITTDSDGNFRVGATPHEMACFINEALPDSCSLKAHAISRYSFDVDMLLELVERNVDKNMPMLAYYVTDQEKKLMHVYAIVGFLKDESNSQLMVLDTVGEGSRRLKKMDASDFVRNMDAQSIIGFVTSIDTIGLMVNLRGAIIGDGGRVVDSLTLKQWKPFSLISFVEGDNLPPDVEPEQKCVLQ